MDAVTGGLQDKVKKRTRELNPLEVKDKLLPNPTARVSSHESMLWTNLSGCASSGGRTRNLLAPRV